MTTEGFYLLLLASLAVTAISQLLVKTRYAKYSQIANSAGITGADVARRMLNENDVNDVKIVPTSGTLTDHYNPTDMTVNLSEGIYNSASIAGVAVAAHECGHATQHHVGYAFIKLRTGLIPILNITSKISYAMILIGFAASITGLLEIGIILESVAVLFQLITLPVEFDASRRGLKFLRESNLLDQSEIAGAKSMLTAAALTYVGAAMTGIVNILRLILITNQSRRRR